MEESNPVVLLCGDVWHIVESSRASRRALCGAELRDRRAHSRLRTVGREHVCPACLQQLGITNEAARNSWFTILNS